jgi:hypothetical protein
LRNAIGLDYARHRAGYAYRLDALGDPESEAYAIAAASVRLFERRPWQTRSDVVTREASASAAMCHYLARYALPHEAIVLEVGVDDVAQLGAGDTIGVTDAGTWPGPRTCILGEVERSGALARLSAVAPHPLLRSIRGLP